MDTDLLATPFGNEPLEEIHLSDPPLARVIVQLRFPSLSTMADESVAHTFVKRLSDEYPFADEGRELALAQLTIDPSQPQPQQQPVSFNQIWRLQSADGNWFVTLGRNTLGLDTVKYTSRQELVSRFARVSDLFIELANPRRFDRIGVRYINRIDSPDIINRIPELIRPEMAGLSKLNLPSSTASHHEILEAQFDGDHVTTIVRCGYLPPQTTLDPSVPPTDLRSWIFDIDSAIAKSEEISPTAIGDLASMLAGRDYRFFRYAVSAAFLELFGGQR